MAFELKKIPGKKVLITGGLGFIGSNLAIRCLELEADVYLFTNTTEKIDNIREIAGRIKIIKGDITSKESIIDAIKGKDIIFHLAAQTSHTISMENPILDIDINLIGTMNILESCREYNKDAKIISLGTVTQAGIVNGQIKEGIKDSPIELYSANKLICEKYFQIYNKVYGLYTAFLRLNTIFGERQRLDNPKRGITNFFIGRILRREPITIYGDGKWIRDYNHVSNIVDALVLCSQNENAKGKSYVVGGEKMQFIEMVNNVVQGVEKVTGIKGEVTFVPFPEDEKKIDVGNIEVDYSRIKNELGWFPKISFSEGIEKTARYIYER